MKAKRMLRVAVVIVCNLLVAVSVFGELTTTERQAAEQAVQRLVTNLGASPKALELERIAVYELDNDEDAAVTDILINELTQTRFQVILREELERVMKEHEFSRLKSDLLDAETVRQLGSFLGVDGIIFGKITEREIVDEVAHLYVDVKLASVETGEAVWAAGRDGEAGEPPKKPFPYIVIAILAGILFLIWLVVYLKGPAEKAIDNLKVNKKARLDKDRALRNKMVRELQGVVETLRTARDESHSKELTETTQSIRNSETELQRLRDEIDTASYGSAMLFTKEKISSAELDRMLDFEKTFDAQLGDLQNGAMDVKKAVASSDAKNEIGNLNAAIKKLRDKFVERADFLSKAE